MYRNKPDAVKQGRGFPTPQISTRLRGRHHRAQKQWCRRLWRKTKLAVDEGIGKRVHGEGDSERPTEMGPGEDLWGRGKEMHKKGQRMSTGPGGEPGKGWCRVHRKKKVKALEKLFHGTVRYPNGDVK